MAATKRTAPASPAHVKKILASYAERGVFRSFSQVAGGKGQAEFRFNWLWSLPFHLTFDAQRGALSFRKLLPGIPAGSQLEAELKAFIDSLSSEDRPEHRRMDRSRLTLRYSNLRGTVTLTFRILGKDCEYGVRKALMIVNEVFLSFLNVRFPEYMVEKFKLPED